MLRNCLLVTGSPRPTPSPGSIALAKEPLCTPQFAGRSLCGLSTHLGDRVGHTVGLLLSHHPAQKTPPY